MISQPAQVVSVEGESAEVRIGADPACPVCAAGRGCGAGIFASLLKRRSVVVSLPNTIGAAAGQAVNVDIPERLYLSLLARLYLSPLLAGLAGAVLGHHLGSYLNANSAAADGLALTGALIGSGVAIGLTRKRSGVASAASMLSLSARPGARSCRERPDLGPNP